MTREEAILLLHDMKDTYDEIHENTNGDIGYEQMTALDMAIEALSADADCSTCKHKDKDWDSEECDSCCGNNNHYASAEAESDDLIIKGAKGIQDGLYNIKDGKLFKYKGKGGTVRTYPIVPSADAVQGWIPVSERLPEDIRPVLVTWKNNDPASYYQYIVGKHFIGTAHYYRGNWWDATVIDILAEYGEDCNAEQIDEDIEVVAWQPLPKPYECGARMKGGDTE